MTLPPLTIPEIPLPFEIPAMMHPVLVHFAIALPIVVLLLEFINLFTNKRTIGVLSFFFMLLATILFFGAYLTGATDGQAAKEFLSPVAKDALVAHKQLGVYLVYASGLVLLFKLFSVLIRKTPIKVLFFLVLLVFVVALLNEGKKGGELVYQYGVNVKSVPSIGKEIVEPKAVSKVKKEASLEAPVVEEKKSEAPKMEKKVEVPKIEVPKAEAPKVEEAEAKSEVVKEQPTSEATTPEGNISQ